MCLCSRSDQIPDYLNEHRSTDGQCPLYLPVESQDIMDSINADYCEQAQGRWKNKMKEDKPNEMNKLKTSQQGIIASLINIIVVNLPPSNIKI